MLSREQGILIATQNAILGTHYADWEYIQYTHEKNTFITNTHESMYTQTSQKKT